MTVRPSRAQSAYSAANLQRQRDVVADARRAELAIVSEADECFGHIMSDHRDGSLSDATLRRRLESFSLSVRDVLEKALVLGSRTWWNASVDVWARAAEQDPALLRAIAFSPRASTLRESASEYRAAAFALLEIMAPPSALEVLSIINAPVNGQTWRERLSVMTSLRVSQSEMSRAIAKSYAAGGNISDVQKAIRPLVQKSASAARTIARTESMRVANTMRERASEAAGDAVVGYTRRATLDDVTRPEHARQNGRVFKKGEARPSMPDGPNCVLPGTLVSGRVQAVMRATYRGSVYTIATESGSTLSVTAKHGVLTATGFVAAENLHEGDEIVGHLPSVEAPANIPNQNDRPSAIEEVFAALGPPAIRWRPSPADLHGDGRLCEGEIEVVLADRELLLDLDAAGAELGREGVLGRGRVELPRVPSGGSLDLHRLGVVHSAAGFVGGRHAGAAPALGDLRPLHSLRLGLAAELDVCCKEASRDGYPVDPEFFRELVHAGAGSVATSKIIKIERREYLGHVYDLQCGGGWYAANGTVSKNCRCWYDDILATDITVFGRPGSLPPEARHVEAFARWFDGETPARKVAAVGTEAFERAVKKYKTTDPSWEQIGGATPDIESQRIRGELDAKIAAAKARRSA